MARPLNTELRIGPPNRRVSVATETRYLMGSAEGPWWFKWSWWVIPVGLVLLILPWVLYFRGGKSTATPAAPAPRVIERVIEKPARPTQPAISHWPSREECERYYVLTLHEAPGPGRCN